MTTMSNNEPLKRLYVRTTPEGRRALKLVRARLLALPATEDVSQEEMVVASWLWMATLDADELASHLAPFVAKVRAPAGDLGRGRPGQAPLPRAPLAPVAGFVTAFPGAALARGPATGGGLAAG